MAPPRVSSNSGIAVEMPSTQVNRRISSMTRQNTLNSSFDSLDEIQAKHDLTRTRSMVATWKKEFENDVASFFPSKFERLETKGRSKKCRERSVTERVFIVFDKPESCRLGQYVLLFVLGLIVVSAILLCLETLPSMHHYNDGCDICKPVKADNSTAAELRGLHAAFCADPANDCEPKANKVINSIEALAVAIFTIEYLIRIGTCWSSPSDYERNYHIETTKAKQKIPKTFEFKTWRKTKRVILWATKPLNLVDLIAILPFYVGLIWDAPSLHFLRLMRMTRLMRLLKSTRYGNVARGLKLVMTVLVRSLPALFFLLGTSMFMMVIIAALVFYCEQGKWDPATGQYMRSSLYYLDEDEVSPFTSIPGSFWWVLVTFTTVGYGDMSPTTQNGRLVGVLAMYIGIIFLTMPVTIIGSTFQEIYDETALERAKRKAEVADAVKFLKRILMAQEFLPVSDFFNKWRATVEDSVSNASPAALVEQSNRKLKGEIARIEGKIDAILAALTRNSTVPSSRSCVIDGNGDDQEHDSKATAR